MTDTGSLGDKIRISPLDRDEVEIYSTDQKFVDISRKYGDENFNLSPSESDEVTKTAEYTAMLKIFNEIYR